ncbi:outer membrane protein OmpK [Paludibacterium purpuratum]|uniref:Nucleoside-specific channel-forming protein Tsx n=1 Tax=Paludibacterium purpuratum TaxID=1144873 RepID=A0A4R7BCT7_9NEIS|nr:outer membrane protein OmpK [Paludibacterium purpuratum]TDR82864.1 nucleoside-specific channel-forming protein Tsx [Paludibacterium purpuratum]
MKTLKIALALAMAGGMAAAHADYTFGDVSINQLNWSPSTLDKTQSPTTAFGAKRNFQYLEAEGGAGRSWGDVYGFFDLENWNRHDPQMKSGDQRYTFKVVARFNLTEVAGLPIKLYTHVYDTRDSDTDPQNHFFDQNRVLGLSTDLNFGKVWVHPFLGRHQEMKYGQGTHMNGYMAGYVAGYDFDLFGQSFAVTQWHETEFDRNENHFTGVADPAGVEQKRTGQNGAVSLWWNATKHLTTGVQYRYAVNKLGTSGNEYAWIYTAKYNF